MNWTASIGAMLIATSGLAHAQAGGGTVATNSGTANFADDLSGIRISVFPVTPITGDPFTSPDSLQLGGLVDFNGGSSLAIRGAPYGYYDTGTLLSIVSTSHSLYNARAGINSGYSDFPAGMIAMSKDPDFNSVNLYNQTTALPPRFVLSSGISYTPTQIQLATPLTPAQMSQLRPSMWVTTNSIDPTMASVATGALATAANSGDSALTLAGSVSIPVGSYVKAFHGGINGPTVTVTSASAYGGNTVVGLSSPLVDGGTDASPVTSYAVGTSYGFVTYNTPVVTIQAASVGTSTLTVSGVYSIAAGSPVPSGNPGIAAGTSVVSAQVSGYTTIITLSQPLISDEAGDAGFPSGSTFYIASPRPWPAGQHIPTITYGSTITGWDAAGGTWISVNGWTVAGANRPVVGQVPSTLLDPGLPYASQTAFIGTPTTATINNWVQSYDPTPAIPGSATPSEGESSKIQQFEGLELDQWNFAKRDFEATFRGLTIGYSPLALVTSGGASHGVLPSTDSYDLQLAGNMPTLLRFTGGSSANYMIGESLLVRGNGGVQGAAGNTGELFEHSAFMDGGDNFRLVDWLQKDTNAIGAAGGSMHLGLILNGAQGSIKAPQSQIIFNVPGAGGGSIGLFGYGGGGFYTDTVGNSYVTPNDSLIFKTASNSNGGAVAADSSGDLLLGTRTAGASTISTAPLVAQNGLTIQGGANTNPIAAPSLLVRSNLGVAGAAGNQGEMFEHNAFMDGIDDFRLTGWLQKDTATAGASGGSLHLGLLLNGAQGTLAAPQSQIMFNVPGAGPGSVGLFGYSGGGLYTDTVGNSYVTPNDSLIFKTASNSNGGAVAADSSGDLLLGSRTAGAATISTAPLVAQNGLTIQSSAGANTITAPSMLVRGNGGASGAAGNTGELFEQSGFMDGRDNFRLTGWLQKDNSAIGATGGSLHLGLMLNGAQGSVGTPQSQLVFNVPGVGPGSVGLFGYSGGGLYTDTAGNAYVTPNDSLIFKTASNSNGGAIGADSGGDLLLGSSVAGARTISTAPLVVQSGLTINSTASSNTITAPSMLVRGNGGVSGAVGNTGELFEQSGFIDGANNMRLVDWLSQDSATIGAGGGSMHLGLIIDGAQGSVGHAQGQIVFDPAGFGTGSIGLLGYNNAGMVINAAGNALLAAGNSLMLGSGGSIGSDTGGDLVLHAGAGRVVATAPLALPSLAFAALPATGTPGAEVFCSNCLKPNEAAGSGTGMIVFDDGHGRWVSTAGTIAAN